MKDIIVMFTYLIPKPETDRKDLILRRKGEARNLRGHKKNCIKKFA